MRTLSEEQRMLSDTARAFIREQSPVARLRKMRDTGKHFDAALWRDMCELGWAGILVPEQFGGSEMGYRSLGVIIEEAGRTLAAAPLVSTALIATSALLQAGTEDQQRHFLPKIVGGAAIFALAVDEGPHHDPAKTTFQAQAVAHGYRLNGKKRYVADGHIATMLIVPARTRDAAAGGEAITLFLVPAASTGVNRLTLETVDSRGAADIDFTNVDVREDAILGPVSGGRLLLDQILDRARIGTAAEMLGQAAESLEMTLDHLKTRVQFGQPIGAFQALQHRVARLFIDVELTRACVIAALDGLDLREDVTALASVAKARANDVLRAVSNEMVQLHGGMGMTDAHDAGLYLKRARVLGSLYGSAAFHRNRFATLSGF